MKRTRRWMRGRWWRTAQLPEAPTGDLHGDDGGDLGEW